MNIIMNSFMDNAYVTVHECEKCLKLETELLKKDFIEKETYDKLFRSYTTLEKHCISLEVDTQLNQEIFQRDNSVSNQRAPSFDQYFELKAQSQEKDTVIKKLKERIKYLSGNMNDDKIKKDIEEIETINIELDHMVSKLIAKNEHLKQTYKQLYDSIKPTQKVFTITTLKEELWKLKGKSVIACRESVNKPKVISPVVHKVDLEPLSPKVKNNREAHVDYIRITKENADTLRDVVEQARTSNPLDNALAYACMYTKQIQELLVYVSDTCPSSPLKSEKLVVVTPMNNARKVTFVKTMNDRVRAKAVKSVKIKEWKPTGKMFKNVGYKWTVNDDTYDDPFDFKEEKIKDSKILIDELDLPESNNVLPFPECDSVFYEDFSKVDALSSTNNEDKVFNPGILIHESLFEVTNFETPDKNVKKTTNASLILEDFNPPLYELPFHKEVPGLGALLSFSSKNEEKVYNPGILTSKRVHTSLLPELSHRGTKAFKVTKILESPMEIFPCSYQEDIRVLDVPCFHFYPP
ncbi:hypothetical protein Tco_1203685 [Tanacetum coccineum]